MDIIKITFDLCGSLMGFWVSPVPHFGLKINYEITKLSQLRTAFLKVSLSGLGSS